MAPGQIITNTAAATWTSLPGDVPGERTGAGGVDDHADADAATVTVPAATIDKRAVAGDHAPSVLPDVVVGETVSYAVDLTFPEGVTGPFDLVDDIPAGMAYVTGSASVDDSGLAGTLSAFDVDEPTGDGADLTVTFTGDTTVTADGDPANNSVTVTYQLVVLDVVGNGDGTELTNTASAFGDSDAVTVTAVRPDLSIDKDDGDATGTAGGTVVYTLSYANDGGIAAPSAVVTEVVPDGVLFSSDRVDAGLDLCGRGGAGHPVRHRRRATSPPAQRQRGLRGPSARPRARRVRVRRQLGVDRGRRLQRRGRRYRRPERQRHHARGRRTGARDHQGRRRRSGQPRRHDRLHPRGHQHG